MRIPPSVPMELVLTAALAVSVMITVFAMQDPPGDRTRFTVERDETIRVISERRQPLVAEETPLGR